MEISISNQFIKRAMLALFVVLFSLMSCKEHAKKTSFIDGDDIIPPEPPFWEYFTFFGVDADNDGVRDDVELWINKEYDDPNIRKALKWKAQVLTDFMLVENTGQALLNMEFKNRAHECYLFVSSYRRLDDRAKGKLKEESFVYFWDEFFNNRWRKWRYNQSGRFVPTGIYSGASLDLTVQFQSCTFQIENLSRIIKLNHSHKKFSKKEAKFFSEYQEVKQ